MGCSSPLTLWPQAGWQHLQWVLRMVWLGTSTWQGCGKGMGAWSGNQSDVFPNSPVVLLWFSMCARSWLGGGRRGEGDPW